MLGIRTKITTVSYGILRILPFFFWACTPQSHSTLHTVCELPFIVQEVSGICRLSDGFLYTINDSGNSNTVFRFTPEGKLQDSLTIPESQNVDWEDLTTDPQGHLYIGDFGNNQNDRNDLTIYKISGISSNRLKTTRITFTFEDQKKFPPKRKHRNFDVEAFIYLKNSLYLFTKDRSKPYTGITKVYRIPTRKGHHIATHIASFTICKKKGNCSITSATLSPSKDKVVLLTPTQLIVLHDFNPPSLKTVTFTTIDLHHSSQKEGICFQNDSTLVITEEGTTRTPGKLYTVPWKP